ncbi:protein ENHANCED DOWNY MILDEW 2-like isoform X1 [Senna tora]|uniref:Protein ENHANCED DOWNY MILDEW 2-like isoform X1 n=1 Tax=Senna tora TaxID=362788 RepID=A0A834TSM8_9FABA|nr:protein ENHANCED DOWNY MILDEW 2-like isoform X1 [Senna tora]
MASSDEEGEIVPEFVDNYVFIDDQNEPISISVLPLLWSTVEIEYDLETRVFLSGTSVDGLQKIFKQIIAWKFELSYEQPEISVLSKDKNWITLLRPKKKFQSTIRTVLVTVQLLHFVRRNPEESRISVWQYILKAFSSFDVKPSEYDVQNHVSLIRGAAERDKDLAKSEYLLTFLKVPRLNEDHEDFLAINKSKCIVYSEENVDDSDGVESSADEWHCIGSYDTVCAICDNGGEILPCEGKCLRSFHATNDAGAETFCESLGYSGAEVNAMPNFLCANCKYKQHQCFACGKLGSSDESSNAEVFLCIIPNCGRYYHPECVAKLLSFGVDIEKEEITKRVAAGKTFVCPLHICTSCRKGEDKNVHDLQFAMCRRCPKAYHRKCLPREIAFKSDYDKGINQRAWEGLLDHRILMYCMDHEIVWELGTPVRNHLVFPGMEGKEKKTINLILGEAKVAKSSKQSFEDIPPRRTLVKVKFPNQLGKESSGIQSGDSTEITEKRCSRLDMNFSTGSNRFHTVRNSLKDEKRSISNNSFLTSENQLSLEKDDFSSSSRLHAARSLQQKFPTGRIDKAVMEKPVVKKVKTTHQFANPNLERRILSMIEESTSAFEEEELKKSNQVLSTKSFCSETALDKNFTQGKVEGSVKAIQAALQMLEEGRCLQDAKAICEPGILNQIFFWQVEARYFKLLFLCSKHD